MIRPSSKAPTSLHRPSVSTVLSGTLWVGFARVVVRVLGLVSTLILARLLTPADFGLVAVAAGVIAFLDAFTQLEFAQALIHYQDADDEDFATAWTLNVLRGALLAIFTVAAAYPVSAVVGDDRLIALLLVIAFVPLFGGLESPHFVQFEKRMRFDALFWLMTLTKVAGVALAISMALAWQTYWALIAGMLATTLARTALTFVMVPGRVWLTIRAWRKLMGFSGWLSGAQALGAMANRLDPVFLGLFASASVVGYLHMARELTSNTFNEIAAPLRRVLFPALKRYELRSEAFVSAYSRALAGLFMVLAPASAGLALTAPNAVPLLLGPQWGSVVLPLQCLAAALVFSIPGRLAQSSVMAVGRTKLIFVRNCIVLPVKLTLFMIGAATYGLMGAVAGAIAGMLVETLLNVDMSMRATGIRMLMHVTIMGRSWGALTVMVLAVLVVTGLSAAPQTLAGHAGLLSVQVVVGGVAYTSAHLVLWLRAGQPDGPEATVVGMFQQLTARIRRQSA